MVERVTMPNLPADEQPDDSLDAAWRPLADANPPAELQVLRDELVARYTSFRIGGPADYLARPADVASLRAALIWARDARLPVTIIGGGSNLICADRGIRGLAISYRAEGAPLEVLEEGETIRLRVPAQRMLSSVARYCCDRGWAGLDWAVGLPGTIGGAVANNAGAHGTEMIDNLEALAVVGPDGVEREHDRSWLGARYRHTILRSGDAAERPDGTLVTAAILRLRRGDREQLLALADEHAAWRKEHQPRRPCAGSIFKNPPGTYAGYLIEQAGLKGYQVGGAQISTLHANFIVNVGGATGADVLAIIRHAQCVVREKFGVELETEVEFIGDWENAEFGVRSAE
ncbi:MAG: UDP-N-acetylmuramate dehydrogenase [Chloroflexia bacterium]